MLAEVTTLYRSDERDVPAMLRKLADEIESSPTNASVPVTAAWCLVYNSASGAFDLYSGAFSGGIGTHTIDEPIAILSVGLRRTGTEGP